MRLSTLTELSHEQFRLLFPTVIQLDMFIRLTTQERNDPAP